MCMLGDPEAWMKRRSIARILRMVVPAAAALTLCGCTPIGGCTADDQSRYILLQYDGLSSDNALGAIDQISRAALLQEVAQQQIPVGYYYDPSCWGDPWHESDLLQFYATSEMGGYLQDLLHFEDGMARRTAHFSRPNLGSQGQPMDLDLQGSFSVEAAQAALDEVYSRRSKYKRYLVPLEDRIRVPVVWEISGKLGGQPFEGAVTARHFVTLAY